MWEPCEEGAGARPQAAGERGPGGQPGQDQREVGDRDATTQRDETATLRDGDPDSGKRSTSTGECPGPLVAPTATSNGTSTSRATWSTSSTTSPPGWWAEPESAKHNGGFEGGGQEMRSAAFEPPQVVQLVEIARVQGFCKIIIEQLQISNQSNITFYKDLRFRCKGQYGQNWTTQNSTSRSVLKIHYIDKEWNLLLCLWKEVKKTLYWSEDDHNSDFCCSSISLRWIASSPPTRRTA